MPPDIEPITERTRAIRDLEAAIARVEAKLEELKQTQDVTEAVRMIRHIYSRQGRFEEAIKRAFTQFMSFAFPKPSRPASDEADGQDPPLIS